MSALPATLDVLIFRGGHDAAERVRAVAPTRLRVHDLSEEFVDELVAEWPGWIDSSSASAARRKEERDALVREAHVMFVGFPFPKALPQQAHNLLWAHFGFAGVSNLMGTDWWGLEGPVLTSSRGHSSALPIAETTIAAALMLVKRLDHAVRTSGEIEQAPRDRYAGMRLVEGKTMGIVGLGGIGSHVARLARGLGMRVVATRRSATARQRDVDGVDELFPPERQNEMLAQCDFVTVCAMWTPESEGLIDASAFAAMKDGVVVVSVARGELIDELALVDALRSRRVAGAYLDVWHNDLLGAPPRPELQAAPNVIFTPHVSGSTEVQSTAALDLLVDNLARFLDGEPLANVIDWSRGY